KVHGLGEALGDRPEVCVEERAREVRARLDVRRVGAPLERERHLVRRRNERVADHLERDRIDADARSGAGKAGTSAPGRLRRAYAAARSGAGKTDTSAPGRLRRAYAAARSGAGNTGTSTPGRLRRAYAVGHPYTSRARPALTLPSRTSVSTSAGSRSVGEP